MAKARVYMTEEIRTEAIRLAISGGNQVGYLKDCGFGDPAQAWYRLKKKLKEEDPETFEQLPESEKVQDKAQFVINPKKAAKRAQEAQEVKAEETPVQTAEAPAEAKEAPKPAIYAPLNYMGFNVTTIEDPEIGAFHYDRRHGFIDWTGPDGVECASLEVEVARKIYHAAPTILGILGVAIDGD